MKNSVWFPHKIFYGILIVTWIPTILAAPLSPQLSSGAQAALKSPPQTLPQGIHQELLKAWRTKTEPLITSNCPGGKTSFKVTIDRVNNKPFVHFSAIGLVKSQKKRLEIQRYHNAKPRLDEKHGRWFKPVQFGGMFIQKANFSADRAAFSTLTKDGSEAFYWQKGPWFIQVNTQSNVKSTAQGILSEINRIKLYAFPKSGSSGGEIVSFDIPSHKANIDKLTFFESDKSPMPKNQRTYKIQFDDTSARYIHWELNLNHKAPGAKTPLAIDARWFDPSGTRFNQNTNQSSIGPGWTSSYHGAGYGNRSPGFWKSGVYRVELYVNGAKITEGSFKITGKPNPIRKTYDIASLTANVTKVKFFESSKNLPAINQRTYQSQFEAKSTRYINWELHLEHPSPTQRKPFQIIGHWYKPDGAELSKSKLDTYIDSGWTTSHHTTGWGWVEPGNWQPGTYRIDFYVDGKKITHATCEITGQAQPKPNNYDIASIKAKVESMKLFESGYGKIPRDQRVYQTHFPKSTARYINWALNLSYPAPGMDKSFNIDYKYYNPDGSLSSESTKSSQIKSTWRGSWHWSGRGWKAPGKWSIGKYRVDLVVDGKVVASKHFEIYQEKPPSVDVPGNEHSNVQADSNEFKRYMDLSPDFLLCAAEIQLSEEIKKAERSNKTNKLSLLKQIETQLEDPVRKYEFYISGNSAFLTPQWENHYNKMMPSPDAPRLENSPFSLLAHLHLAREKMSQTFGNAQVQDVQYTALQGKKIDALREASGALDDVIKTVGKALGKSLHTGGSPNVFLEIPNTFKPGKTEYKQPINAIKYDQNNKPLAVVLVEFLETEHTISTEEFYDKRIEKLRSKFKDLHATALTASSGGGYDLTIHYEYQYTWDGDPIKSRVYAIKNGQSGIFLSCTAKVNHFDDNEMNEIIHSFHRMLY